MTGDRKPPVDQEAREAAVHERDRNVILDAGAGTGKTTTLVRRLIHLLAPEDDGPAYHLHPSKSAGPRIVRA